MFGMIDLLSSRSDWDVPHPVDIGKEGGLTGPIPTIPASTQTPRVRAETVGVLHLANF
jgi:hypothetical protein